jgi:hypothetical protein
MSVTKDGKVWVCRGELRLARQAVDSLRKVPLSPDPLSVFARAMEEVDHARGELAEIAMDLLPATPGRRRRLVKRLTRQGAGHHSGGGAKLLQDIVDELTGGAYTGRGTRTNGSQKREPVDVVAQRRGLQSTAEKLLTPEGMFETQVLVRTEARNEQRADALFRGVLQAFEVFAGENNLRVSGLGFGFVFLGSDMWWRRRWFDERLGTGFFRPNTVRGGNVVNVSEIAGLLKPFTARCPEDSVVRGGPWMPPADPTLPIWRAKRGVLPLGLTTASDGTQRMVGMDTATYLFGTICGRSGMGKTETALGQFLHVALIEGDGCLFFDPTLTPTPSGCRHTSPGPGCVTA